MISAFRMGPAANAACVISMEYYSELLNHVSKKLGSYPYSISHVSWLSDPYEMPKTWNLLVIV